MLADVSRPFRATHQHSFHGVPACAVRPPFLKCVNRRYTHAQSSNGRHADSGNVSVYVADSTSTTSATIEPLKVTDTSTPISVTEQRLQSPVDARRNEGPISAASQTGFFGSIIRLVETKLHTDMKTLGLTILFSLAIILVNWGVEGLWDIAFGESIVGAIWCQAVGMAMIVYVRLSGIKLLRLWLL